MTIKEIDKQIHELRNKRYEIEAQEREEFKKAAIKNVGRCFVAEGQYVKVIGIPQEEYNKIGECHFNQYQYPALYIGKSFKIGSVNNEVVPFYEDTLFSGAWGVGNNLFEKEYKEITPEEFNAEFDRVLQKFRRKICGD